MRQKGESREGSDRRNEKITSSCRRSVDG